MRKTFFTVLFSLVFALVAFGQQTMNEKTDKGELRCQSLTKAGTQCTKTATMPDKKCKIHSGETVRCDGQTKAGKKCTRPAGKAGKCWQHDETRQKEGKQ